MIICTFEKGHTAKLRHVVVHAIVEKDGQLLLVKRNHKMLLEPDKWSLPAGFLERDETAEEGTLRELAEETGWQGKVTALFRIITRPDRPHEDRQNIAFVYLVKPIKQVSQPDKESTEIRWFPIEDLPPLPLLAFDHGQTLNHYLKYRLKPFPLPLAD